ncbi:MAG: TetR family transcriptional regulator [Parvularculaceae bacterium]
MQRIRGLNSLQIGETLFVTERRDVSSRAGGGLLSRRFDPRAVTAAGLVILAFSTREFVFVTSEWGFREMFWPQVGRREAGLMLVMAPLNVVRSARLKRRKCRTLERYNLARNLGGAFGLAIINTLLNDRTVHHVRMLADNFDLSRPAMTERLSALTAYFTTMGVPDAEAAALRALSNIGRREAVVLAFSDIFQLITLVSLMAAPLLIVATAGEERRRRRALMTGTMMGQAAKKGRRADPQKDEAIIDAASALSPRASMASRSAGIAAAAGVSKQTIYARYAAKSDLLAAVVRRTAEDLIRAFVRQRIVA